MTYHLADSVSLKRKKIIVVDDDHEFLRSIVKYLIMEGYDAIGACTAHEFYQLLYEDHALAIVDLGLPDQSGLVLVEYLRRNTQMRIIVLTACSSLNDKLAGHSAGADMYLIKPIDFRELAASIATLFSRFIDTAHQLTEPSNAPSIHCANPPLFRPWKLIRSEWQLVTPSRQRVQLTAKEFAFISLLISGNKETVSRKNILAALGYLANESAHRSLEALVNRLRHKIQEVTSHNPIRTVHGSGYSFVADSVEE